MHSPSCAHISTNLTCCAFIFLRCDLIFLHAFPAVPLFSSHLTCLTPYPYFSLHLPCCALSRFTITLTLLCPYFSSHLPSCALIFFALPGVSFFSYLSWCSVIPLYDYYLRWCAIIFLRTYPAVPYAYPAVPLFIYLFFLRTYFAVHLPCCAVIFLCTYS